MSTRSILRNKVRNATYSRKENGDFNRRRFAVVWQKIQIKKFGGVKKYIIMRIHKKSRSKDLNVTIFA